MTDTVQVPTAKAWPWALATAAAVVVIAVWTIATDSDPSRTPIAALIAAGVGALIASYTDLRARKIYNATVAPTAVATFGLLALHTLQLGDTTPALWALAGAATAALIYGVFYLYGGGGGDLKLAPVLVAAAAYLSPAAGLVALTGPILLTLPFAIALRNRGTQHLPMAPFMTAGLLLAAAMPS